MVMHTLIYIARDVIWGEHVYTFVDNYVVSAWLRKGSDSERIPVIGIVLEKVVGFTLW